MNFSTFSENKTVEFNMKKISQIAIASCNSFQKGNNCSRTALAHGRRGEAPSGGSQRRGPQQAGQFCCSRGIDAVELALEKLLRSGITEDFSRQTIDAVGE